jgi:crotonobetainyl-CoA:carnitine CoA-transferase CaiB-like acyl-CoA transferase
MPVKSLNNVTVFECATFVTGPYATSLLADLGARVIKIESTPDGILIASMKGSKLEMLGGRITNSSKQALAPTFKSRTRFDNLPCQTSAPPLVGEHSGKVLRELGNRDDDIAAFQS